MRCAKWIGANGKGRITMTQNELDKILKAHKKWLNNEEGGHYADLLGANLHGADLHGADLRGANLQAANLHGANLQRADLQRANFRGANLRGANLRGANIDYSCWPLWCGSLGVKVDRRIFCQLAYHLCRVIVDDDECKEAQLRLGRLANEFHRADECGRVPEKEDSDG